jgi:CHAT domain-containing protein/Tfp pilus assembly protein PilF
MGTQRPRTYAWAGLVAALALGCAPVPLRAADPTASREPGEAERDQLQKQASDQLHRASTLYGQGKLPEAVEALEQALEMEKKLWPAGSYPQGHPDLVLILNLLGACLQGQGKYEEALTYNRQALEMCRKLYPHGHRYLVSTLLSLGRVLQMRGEYGRALAYDQQALEMTKSLYPKGRDPEGDMLLALCFNNLALLLKEQGEYGRAKDYYEQALEVTKKLPEESHPYRNHLLAAALDNLGILLQVQGEYDQALEYHRQALGMYRKLYPAERFPNGHSDLATSLNNLGALLQQQREYSRARDYFEQALAMKWKLYPPERYSQGHALLALGLSNLGRLLEEEGLYEQALDYFNQALVMRRKLYPQGHPDLALNLANLGSLLQAQQKYGQALVYYREALELYARLASAFADAASEAEALNYLVSLPPSRDAFLTCSAALPGTSPEESYAPLWEHKATVTAVMQRRQLLHHAATDDGSRRLASQLLDVRRQLARLLLTPDPASAKDREQRLTDLTSRKEELERLLAEKLPEFAHKRARERAPHADLLAQLPPGTAFVDLIRYDTWDATQRHPGETRYTAFVLQRGEPARRAELGPAAPIEQALALWRQDIEDGRDGAAADQLRRLAWEPVAKQLREGTDAVYLSPEGPLAALPWAALPGSKPGTVLLEEYALALAPHGPFLLDQLTAAGPSRAAGIALVLGGVGYDQGPDPLPDAKPDYRRSADLGRGSITWRALPGTAAEADQIAALARRLAAAKVVELRGRQAGTERLLRELPRARWAHLATHGFFAARQNEEERRRLLREADFGLGVGMERRGAGARNPLVQTGLVLAGANLPPKDDPLADDRGLLTAEALAGLDLRGLELCVLSACNTGRGEAVGGEGVFGLQRALHRGGCRSVVASLWKVDDDATATLMALFYRNLWEKKEPPLQALRHAQLTLLRHPAAVPLLAKERGPNFDVVVRRVEAASAEPSAGESAPVRHWAAFVLSGLGR